MKKSLKKSVEMKIFLHTALLVCLMSLCFATHSSAQVIAKEEPLLAQYEKSDKVFTKLEIGNIVSYFHQRMIGEAIVEKDFIRYQFNTVTGKLIEQKVKWREGLPAVITREEAESKVAGTIRFSDLFYISPESDVFPVGPVPQNPCWIVRSLQDGMPVVTIIDAVTGEYLGNGVPPPYEGLSIHGPDWGACPKDPIWYNWAENARSWFATMGYNTERIGNASDAQIQGHIQSDTTAMFYELDHGGSWDFHNQCNSDITADEIRTWIATYASMPFAFIGSCDGMCDQSAHRFSFEFRKGSNTDTTVVGYCGMSTQACDQNCWPNSIPWQTSLFTSMNNGNTVSDAFNDANLAFPNCANNNCMRFAGDTTLTVVPVVKRSLCGTLSGTLSGGSRDHYIRCDITSGGNMLSVGNGATLVFLNNSKVIASSPFAANGAAGEVRFVSEHDRTKGMKLTGGLRMNSGGQMKIYE